MSKWNYYTHNDSYYKKENRNTRQNNCGCGTCNHYGYRLGFNRPQPCRQCRRINHYPLGRRNTTCFRPPCDYATGVAFREQTKQALGKGTFHFRNVPFLPQPTVAKTQQQDV